MQGQMKRTCFKQVLHNLQGHSGFHFLIFSLNDSKDLLFFIASWTIDQTLGARYDITSVMMFPRIGSNTLESIAISQ